MKYDKLVRDKIPKIIKDEGRIPITYIADNLEYWERLKDKLQEEVNEVLEDTNIKEELADVLEVIHAMINFKWITSEELEKIRQEKKNKRWWFKKRIILKEIKSIQ